MWSARFSQYTFKTHLRGTNLFFLTRTNMVMRRQKKRTTAIGTKIMA